MYVLQWAEQYWGYTLCVAVGVAFIILMPIIGLFLCLCRCAGRCGAKRRYDDVVKRDRCRRATCGLLLLILATLITYATLTYLLTHTHIPLSVLC